MANIVPGRMTADHSGDIVVFIIGMRVNNWFAIGKWLPVFNAVGLVPATGKRVVARDRIAGR